MIARLLISPELSLRIDEINKIMASQMTEEDTNYLQHPDVLYFPSGSKLGIEQTRKIKEHFSFRPYQSKGKAVVLEDASVLTVEAQNALLKTLEEPPQNAILLLGSASSSKFLPTILSRCEIVILNSFQDLEIPKQVRNDVEKLISATLQERFEFIEKLKEKDEFLKSLVSYFHRNLTSNTKNKSFIKNLLQAEEWANQNVNIRAILEYLMLVMPEKV